MKMTHEGTRAMTSIARSRRIESRVIQIVVTPGSGNGRALHKALHLRDALHARGHRAKLEVFSDLDTLSTWAATGRSRFSLLICVGGDGTLDTTAAAAVRRYVPFLAVGSGFGNLFASALGQPDRVERVIDLVERGELVHVDVGVRNDRLFLCQESYGFLDEIQQRTEASPHRPRGRWRRTLAYYQTAIRHVREAPLTPLRVSVDGRVVARDAVIVTVANVETYGAWLPLTPDASPIDGLLDVFVMRRTSKREILARLVKRQLRLPGADTKTFVCRGRHISVAGPHLRDELHVMPRRLPVIVSSETAQALARGLARVGGFSEPSRRQVA
jgi:diacylglycerol kinase (ATP)